MSWKGLFASESLLALSKKQFSSHKFPVGTPISDQRYKHLESKHKSIFYYFNDQLDYALIHYFEESKTARGNINEFLTDPLMVRPIEKLLYKNADKWIEKLLELSQGISEDEQIKYKFEFESGVSRISEKEIVIQSQNIVSCVYFLKGHPSFQYNQTYKPYHIYNQNKD